MHARSAGTVRGIVQGVGFRPFIYKLAVRCGLTGFVTNTSQGVELEVEGRAADIDRFFAAVSDEGPPLAQISSIERSDDIPVQNDREFSIRKSRAGENRSTLVSPDVCVCEDCLREMNDQGDRRFRYPFINCTHCGPRYTIIRDIPYDRPLTTMDPFKMCPACLAEYEDPGNRRFHAQPNACWECGPRLELRDGDGRPIACEDPVGETIRRLKEGGVVAVKGLGGFHLAADAQNPGAVARLRGRKHREEKPLAVMVRDVDAARSIAVLSRDEIEALSSRRRPIVIVKKQEGHGLAPDVAPRNHNFGVMLPYTPLHYLLFMEGGFKALVMTSGNLSEEPITIDNEDAVSRLRGIADAFLVNDREIHLRSDDSIVRVVDGTLRHIRRSRGFVPVPVQLPEGLSGLPPVLAVGAELKNTLCLTKGSYAFPSQHVGDMENLETLEFFRLTAAHLERILEIKPEVLAADLHPDYLSTRYALERTELPLIRVQHHHAHIVSVLAENGFPGPVIGLALDGTGLGEDRTIWGGEVLTADLTSYERVGHLQQALLPGGDAAARNPRRMALSYLFRSYGRDALDLPLPFLRGLDPTEARLVTRILERRVHSPWTSSCGRLFDAVSALAGVCGKNSYEGQAAVELEMIQDEPDKGFYPWSVQGRNPRILETGALIRAIVEDLLRGVSQGVISRRFHNTLIELFSSVCYEIRQETRINEVALSGGVFQNASLLAGLSRSLRERGFRVFTHSRVPTNDGGVSLGQAVCAALRSREL